MELLNYTTYDEIRSLLGVSRRELADEVIALPHWTLAVEQDLMDLDVGGGAALTQYDTVAALTEGTLTAAQTQFYKVTRMYVLYLYGWQLMQRADVFSPVSITDGKAALQRLEDRFDKLRPAIDGGVTRLKERVRDALLALVPSALVPNTVLRTMIVGVGIGTDPVTGE